jgi:triosephosphate isomerase
MRRTIVKFARTPIVGGNWKMNAGAGTTLADVNALVAGLNAAPAPKCEVFCAPPALYLAHVQATLGNGMVTSAQNCYKTTSGAFTGETSAEMLVDANVPWTLIGHSERRDVFGESDALLGEKIAHAQSVGLGVVACCGEHKDAREAGTTMDILIPQLQAIADSTGDWSKMVIAYEPVWAIGTGLTATTEQAQGTCADIRGWLAENVSAQVADETRIQYGGSVNDGNAEALASAADVDGFLIGGAALHADKFATCYGVFN